MDSHMERTHEAHGHHYDQNPLDSRPVEGEDEQHHTGKTSVFKRVKAKAKKIKDNIGFGHGHDHDHGNINEHDEEEDEELVPKPEIHGAPTVKNTVSGQDGNKVQPRDNLGQDLDQNVSPGTFQTKVTEPVTQANTSIYDSGNPQNFGTDPDEKSGQLKDSPGGFFSKDYNADKHERQDVSPTNYDTKWTQDFGKGGEEDRVDPILKSFGKMDIYDEPQHKKESTTTGSHDQYSPNSDWSSNKISTIPENTSPVAESFNASSPSTENYPQDVNVNELAKQQSDYTGTSDGSFNKTNTIPENTSVPESFNASNKNYPQEMNVDEPAKHQSGYMGISDQSSNTTSTDPENPSVPESFNASTENYPRDVNVNEPTKQQSDYTGTSDWFSNKTSIVPENTSVPEKACTENYPQEMNVDEPAKHQSGYMGISDQSSNTTSTDPENPSVPESFNASTANYPQDMNVDEPAKQQSGYTSTISSVPSAITGSAIAAKNVVASRIGYGVANDNRTGSEMNKEGDDVVSAGVPMTSTESVREPATAQPSSYADKFSSATSAIAGMAVSSKNAVASKLGYGGTSNPSSPTASEMNKGTPTTSEINTGDNAQTGGETGYGRQIADTLAPVYAKVAGVGSAVVSKLPGTGTYTNAGTDSGTHTNTGLDTDRGAGVPVETGSEVGGATDKGVGVTGYIAEKLKPGEEDKALSDLISGAFGKGVNGEEKEEKRALGEVASDAFHKRNNDDDDMERERENKPMGKVTESEEVANRLGSSESEKLGYKVSGSESPSAAGSGVVDKFKGAFTNWFGKGGETDPSQAFNDHTPSHDSTGEKDISTLGGDNESRDGERRLHEE